MSAGAHKSADYLTMNPNGQVPVLGTPCVLTDLDDNGFVLTESSAIIMYLADKYFWMPSVAEVYPR